MQSPDQHSASYVAETNFLINYFENPDGQKIDFDCPVIDPNDPDWCPENSNGNYYRVACKHIHFLKNIEIILLISSENFKNKIFVLFFR